MAELGCADKEISLLLLDDRRIREINRRYLDRDRPTNVLSFSLADGECGGINPDVLGDIVVSVETAAAEAEAGGVSFEDTMDYLLIHGFLHLLGYDHERSGREAAEEMRRKEDELSRVLNSYSLEL